jgi:hypothetical protein
MAFQDDLVSLYGFLQHTNQGNLKRMLVDGQFTEVHLNLLLKVVKNCTEAQFIEMINKGELPKIKLSNSETALKEKFWNDCLKTFQSRGLVSAPMPQAA